MTSHLSVPPRVVYVSFDRVPAPKGAAVHIAAFTRALGRAFAPVELITIEPPAPPDQPRPAPAWREHPRPRRFCPGVSHIPLHVRGRHLFERAMSFRTQLLSRWGPRRVPVVHVRSIYEGYPLARAKRRLCDALVYEVNGLPSIELKYHYPAVADDHELMAKLRHQERVLLDAADLVVTPSPITARYLAGQGKEPGRIRVIPNGVDLDLFSYRAPRPAAWQGQNSAPRVLYCGTLTAWQGIRHAIEAVRLYRRDRPATLTVVGPGRKRRRREIADLCQSLGLADAVTLLEPVSQAELAALYHEHDVTVAPLPRNDRNLVQGCCPLKILEAMATGTPLIASDLPVVRDLVDPDREALLVKPGSAKAIKDAMVRLAGEAGLAGRLSRAGRLRVERQHAWSHAGDALIHAYRTTLAARLRDAVGGSNGRDEAR